MAFWDSLSQACEDLDQTYSEWWDSLTEAQKTDYCIDDSRRKWGP